MRKTQPSANCFLLYDKLYVGNKVYKWDGSNVAEIEGETMNRNNNQKRESMAMSPVKDLEGLVRETYSRSHSPEK